MDVTKAARDDLRRYRDEQSVVTVTFDGPPGSVQLIPTSVGPTFVAGHRFDRFAVDGFVCVELSRAETIWRQPRDEFHQREAELMGTLTIPDAPPLAASSLRRAAAAIPPTTAVDIDWSAHAPPLSMDGCGWIERVRRVRYSGEPSFEVVVFREFTGTARVEDEAHELNLDSINTISLGTRYLLGYEHYFRRTGLTNSD